MMFPACVHPFGDIDQNKATKILSCFKRILVQAISTKETVLLIMFSCEKLAFNELKL